MNAVDNNGDSALMLAVASNNIELIRILLEKGALINAVNFYGQTALWLAAKHPCLGVIKVGGHGAPWGMLHTVSAGSLPYR